MRKAVVQPIDRGIVFVDLIGPELTLADFHVEDATFEHRQGAELLLGKVMILSAPVADALRELADKAKTGFGAGAWRELNRYYRQTPWSPFLPDGTVRTEYLAGSRLSVRMREGDPEHEERFLRRAFAEADKPEITQDRLETAVAVINRELGDYIANVNQTSAQYLASSLDSHFGAPALLKEAIEQDDALIRAREALADADAHYQAAKRRRRECGEQVHRLQLQALSGPLSDVASLGPRIAGSLQGILRQAQHASPELSC